MAVGILGVDIGAVGKEEGHHQRRRPLARGHQGSALPRVPLVNIKRSPGVCDLNKAVCASEDLPTA